MEKGVRPKEELKNVDAFAFIQAIAIAQEERRAKKDNQDKR